MVTHLQDNILKMRDAYQERRTDVVEIIDSIYSGEDFDPAMVEHRFARFVLSNGSVVEYDTLTTMLYELDTATGEWLWGAIDGDYYNESEDAPPIHAYRVISETCDEVMYLPTI